MDHSELLIQVVNELYKHRESDIYFNVGTLLMNLGQDLQQYDAILHDLHEKRYVTQWKDDRERFKISEEGIKYLQIEKNKRGKMTQKEKLDLILKKLYEYRDDGNYHETKQIMEELGIFNNLEEAYRLAKRLDEDRLAKAVYHHKNESSLEITSHGVSYCEEDSYSHPGTSLITLTITGNNNQTVVAGRDASNVSQVQNINLEAEKLLKELKKALAQNLELTPGNKETAIDCLDEIESDIKAGKAVKKFKWDSLLTNTASSAQIVSLATQLAQVFGYLPSL